MSLCKSLAEESSIFAREWDKTNDPHWKAKEEMAKVQSVHAKLAGLAADGRPEVCAQAAAFFVHDVLSPLHLCSFFCCVGAGVFVERCACCT
jgi:hypothetical protein